MTITVEDIHEALDDMKMSPLVTEIKEHLIALGLLKHYKPGQRKRRASQEKKVFSAVKMAVKKTVKEITYDETLGFSPEALIVSTETRDALLGKDFTG